MYHFLNIILFWKYNKFTVSLVKYNIVLKNIIRILGQLIINKLKTKYKANKYIIKNLKII